MRALLCRAKTLQQVYNSINRKFSSPSNNIRIVKSPYSIKLNVPEPLIAACSGSLKLAPISNGDGTRTFHYEQLQPIPAYLIALVCGDLVKEKLGSRSSVWSEPSMIKASVYEFQQTETYLKLAEEITGEYFYHFLSWH